MSLVDAKNPVPNYQRFYQNAYKNHTRLWKIGPRSRMLMTPYLILLWGSLGARSARRLFVLSQAHQQLSEAFLARARGTSLGSLAAHIHQLGDSVPAGATGNGVLSALEELVGFLSCLGNTLLLLVVVVVIEVIDVLLSLLDCLFSLGSELFGALGNLVVSAFAPFLDNLGFLFLLKGGGLVS
ncbi:hypothetical protein HG531_009674 [Fusarium graminearum]|nr:hypothetical protein HG531_009674 [Fusarium graminearum]